MGKIVDVLGFDPSLRNWGVCHAGLDIETGEFEIKDLILLQTESESKKNVIKQSDDLRSCREQFERVTKLCEGKAFAVSEIPFVNPRGYASANFNAGVVLGLLGSLPIPLIQVFPQDVKRIFTGMKDACKEEMIEEAVKRYPNAPWKMRKFRGAMKLTSDNEHLADAVAVLHAGMATEQYKQLASLYRSALAA
ncbi:hypothetical protein [Chromobacterium phragmitis]|uniref:Uncharacterized protein n=1 Tax=Chromobacterium phragmitis TaxID=2202141 RepID=A0ABV0J0Y0_9NEIS